MLKARFLFSGSLCVMPIRIEYTVIGHDTTNSPVIPAKSLPSPPIRGRNPESPVSREYGLVTPDWWGITSLNNRTLSSVRGCGSRLLSRYLPSKTTRKVFQLWQEDLRSASTQTPEEPRAPKAPSPRPSPLALRTGLRRISTLPCRPVSD